MRQAALWRKRMSGTTLMARANSDPGSPPVYRHVSRSNEKTTGAPLAELGVVCDIQ